MGMSVQNHIGCVADIRAADAKIKTLSGLGRQLPRSGHLALHIQAHHPRSPEGAEGPMSREMINDICRRFPGADVSDPWGGGHDAWKVGGKMFACSGTRLPGVSVKTDSIETATMLIEVGVGGRAPYFHRSWINLPWDTPEDVLRHRLRESYRLIRRSLTKKTQAALPPLV
jgi:predicted DNA-binding protein (MmcQ/YjbR family)